MVEFWALACDLLKLLQINNITTGINPLFICCGKKNQANNNNPKTIADTLKYFFTQLFLLFTKNAITAFVGNAHNKLKLFLHRA